MKLRAPLAAAALFSSAAAQTWPGLVGATICKPVATTVYVDPKAAAWIPNLQADLSKQTMTLAAAYRLDADCPTQTPSLDLYMTVNVYATDAIKDGARAYIVTSELYFKDLGMFPWFDYSVGITSAATTNNRSEILRLARGLMDGMAAAYNTTNK